MLSAAAEAGCRVTSRQFERWVEWGLIPKAERRSGGYGKGVAGLYAADALRTVKVLCEFLKHSKDLGSAGLWAWYQDCPVPSDTAKRLLLASLAESRRELRQSLRRKTRLSASERVDNLAYRYRYRARKLVGGKGEDAYRVAQQVLAVAAGLKSDRDLGSLVDALVTRLRDRLRGFGVEVSGEDLPTDIRTGLRRLSVASLTKTVRNATPGTLEEAKRFLRAHTQVVGTVLVLSGILSPLDDSPRVAQVFVNALPVFIAGVILLGSLRPDMLAALPADPHGTQFEAGAPQSSGEEAQTVRMDKSP